MSSDSSHMGWTIYLSIVRCCKSYSQSINISDLKVTRKRKPLFANEFVISLSMQRVFTGNQKELSLLFDEPLISVDNV